MRFGSIPCAVALTVVACATGTAAAGESPAAPERIRHGTGKPVPLDLRIIDIIRYLDPVELATPIRDDLEEIVVNGRRPEPLPEQRAIPQALGAIVYAGTHPLDAWRIFVPDPNFAVPERSEDDVREPPGAFRGKILEPGAVYD